MKKIILVIVLSFFVNWLFSQQSIVVSGATQNGSSGEISYTIGLPICGMAENDETSFVIGVQQVFDDILVATYEENSVEDGCLNMVVTPNPFVDMLRVTILSDELSEEYFLWIYDMSGNLVNNFDVLQKEIECNLSHLSSGIYYFALVDKTYQLKRSIKVIKQ